MKISQNYHTFALRNEREVLLKIYSMFDEEYEDYSSGYDPYEQSYDEYAGSYAQDVEGYSDQEIDDIFDGDPDAYWNID